MLLCVGNKLSRVSCWRFMDMMMYWAGRELCFFFPFLDLLTIEYQKFFFFGEGGDCNLRWLFFRRRPAPLQRVRRKHLGR